MKNGRGQDIWRIIAKKSQPIESGCVLWTGRTRDGYGRLRVNGQVVDLQRLVLARKLKRPIRRGFLACHTCHVRRCIREEHIYEGTYQSNMEDRDKAGRHRKAFPRGEINGNCRFTPAQIMSVYSHKGLETAVSLSPRVGMSPRHILSIWSGDRWNHLTQARAAGIEPKE